MKRFILLMLVALFLISTSGCNAMKGVGTDIKNSGKHIENIGN